MNRPLRIIAVILILIPMLTILYKVTIAGHAVLPKRLHNTFNIQVSLTSDDFTGTRIIFPVIRSGQTAGLNLPFEISLLRFENHNLSFETIEDEAGILGFWEGDTISGSVNYFATLRLSSPSVVPQRIQNINQYLQKSYAAELQDDIEEMAKRITGNTSDREAARRLFYYVYQEILLTSHKSLDQVLLTLSGDTLNKAMLLQGMLRSQGIPARTVAGIELSPDKKSENRYPLFYWMEVYLDDHWEIMCLKTGNLSTDSWYIPFYKDALRYPELWSGNPFEYRIYVEPARAAIYDIDNYQSELNRKQTWLSNVSLFQLPPSMQNMFRMLLLIPIGTVVLAFSRNIIGLPTFGIFTPILLTLFFKETSLSFGLVFFFFIVSIGVFERYVMDRLYLLAVPRLSILLTLVIVFLGLAAFWNESMQAFPRHSLALFPIVIVTVIIERFSITLLEEGWWNTTLVLSGTLIISILTYIVFKIPLLDILMFTHPELLLAITGILLLIGDYRGYRLSELIRFRDFYNLQTGKTEP